MVGAGSAVRTGRASRASHALRDPIDALIRFLTPTRLRVYPAVVLTVVVAVGVVDRLLGRGLMNGIAGAFGGDFLSFYTGGALVRLGKSELLTNPDAQLAFQSEVLRAKVQEVSLWVSPPFVAWLFVPLSALPYVPAFFVMIGVGVLSVVLAFGALRRELQLPPSLARMLFYSASYYPTLQWLSNGQTTGLWLTVLVLVVVSLRRGRDVTAGILLGLFAGKPQLGLALAVGLLAARRWKTLVAAAVTSSALVLLGFLTLPAAMRAYLHHGVALVALVRDGGYHRVGLHGSFEFATLLLDGISPVLATVVGSALCLGLLGYVATLWRSRSWTPGTRDWDLRMAAILALGTVASPHLYGYDLMLLLLPFFLVLGTRVSPKDPGSEAPLDGGPVLVATATVWALGLVGPALSVMQQTATRKVLGFSMVIQVGVIAIVGWAVAVARLGDRERAREIGPPSALDRR